MTTPTVRESLQQGLALQQQGRLKEAASAFRACLARDPGLAMAWLFLGSAREQQGEEDATECYHLAFATNPRLQRTPDMPPHVRELTRHAGAALHQKYRRLHEEIIEARVSEHGAAALVRVRQCVALQHGMEKPVYTDPLQRPGSVYFPGLIPQPWFERSDCKWIGPLEASWKTIRAELQAVLDAPGADVIPYVNDGPKVPPALRNLADSLDWQAFHLFKGGERVAANCKRCPSTLAAVDDLPLARSFGNAPEVFFSCLRPGTHIRPHFGVANTKLAVHLPLIVPQGDCAIRVGEETRRWREGQCLIFDDSFEHEAWNRGDTLRAVLILEAWNPGLTQIEREVLYALSRTIDDWATPLAGKWTPPAPRNTGPQA